MNQFLSCKSSQAQHLVQVQCLRPFLQPARYAVELLGSLAFFASLIIIMSQQTLHKFFRFKRPFYMSRSCTELHSALPLLALAVHVFLLFHPFSLFLFSLLQHIIFCLYTATAFHSSFEFGFALLFFLERMCLKVSIDKLPRYCTAPGEPPQQVPLLLHESQAIPLDPAA